MTREETKEAIKVMQAFVEGKVIQFLDRNKVWQDLDPKKGMGSNWNWFETAYRIKSEPHYRPFESAEEVMEAIKEHGDWVRQMNNGCYVSIRSFDCEFVAIGNYTTGATYSSAFESVAFADGTPFGKLEE